MILKPQTTPFDKTFNFNSKEVVTIVIISIQYLYACY